MRLFNKNRTGGETYDGQGGENTGLVNVIQYNGEADEIVWKFPHNNISTAAQLVVNQSQEAIFVKGGAFCDVLGPGTHTLSANNIPILQKLINLPFGGKTPFTAEVWYVSKTVRRDLTFGTQTPIQLLDPFYRISIPVRAFGTFGVQVTDSSAFLTQIVGTLHLTTSDDIIKQFGAMLVKQLTACISKYVVREKISIVEISAFIIEVSIYIRDTVNEEFAQYGLRITNVDLTSINFDENNPNVQSIMQKHAEGQGEAAQLAALRGQADMYQLKHQLDIMKTAAGNEGGAGQMMGAGMGLGMGFGVGGAFGAQMGNIAGVMQRQQPVATAPPPPPTQTVFHMLINNVQQQCDMMTVGQMIQSGQITRETFVWKAGMAQWAKAGDVAEFQALLGAIPPPPPPVV